MDFTLTSGASEGKIPRSDYKELREGLDSHMAEIDKWTVPESEETDIEEDEPYEDFLERAQMDWGELYEDDRMWTLDDSIEGARPAGDDVDTEHLQSDSAEGDESIADFMARVESEWGWLEEVELVPESAAREPYTFNEAKWDDILNGDVDP
jgi:hypothetical protein